MIFGKIDYLNLLPLHIYLKKCALPSYTKACFAHHVGVPAKLNKAILKGKIDAAIISSIESRRKRYKTLPIGICAYKKVDSVFVQKGTKRGKDKESASSNALAAILGQDAQVVIGDKALKAYLQNPDDFIDLCSLWYAKTKLPFTFARFSCTAHFKAYKRLLSPFVREKIFIPQYILDNYSKSRGVSTNDIRAYLKLIYYKIGKKEALALKKFLNLASRMKLI